MQHANTFNFGEGLGPVGQGWQGLWRGQLENRLRIGELITVADPEYRVPRLRESCVLSRSERRLWNTY